MQLLFLNFKLYANIKLMKATNIKNPKGTKINKIETLSKSKSIQSMSYSKNKNDLNTLNGISPSKER